MSTRFIVAVALLLSTFLRFRFRLMSLLLLLLLSLASFDEADCGLRDDDNEEEA